MASKPILTEGWRSKSWLSYPSQYMYDGWRIAFPAKHSNGNPRLAILFNERSNECSGMEIQTFDLCLPASGKMYQGSDDEAKFRKENSPAAYIVTDNRGRRYLAFAGSVEHQNAAMFGHEMKPLYE